ncbi:hypothetical protein X975_16645, partial [Stegodyphus mimosarum]
ICIPVNTSHQKTFNGKTTCTSNCIHHKTSPWLHIKT